jgi:hypothetical protein
MGVLGISVYPSQAKLAENLTYIESAAELGYKRIFTSLLELTPEMEAANLLDDYRQIIARGNELGMQTILDINPDLFQQLNVSYDDLSFFADMGAWGLRLDLGFTGAEEAKMTHNPYGLKIEINMSRGQHYIDLIMDFGPNRDNLIGSHNFYPQRFTGLGRAYFAETSLQYRHHNLRSAAFVNAPSGSFGPWPVADGLVSLEDHRNLPIATQVQELKFSGLVDDILIGDAFASEADLRAAADAFHYTMVTMRVTEAADLSEADKKVLYNQPQMYRGDRSDYVLRSTQTRVIYKQEDFPAKNTVPIRRGDLLIDNNDYGQYKGELQIALRDLPNDGRINVVGHIHHEDMALLDMVKPWATFGLLPG